MFNKDYEEMLRIFAEKKVRFLVVGAYAMSAHGYPRATGDFDLWVDASPVNSRRVYTSLSVFGASLSEVTPDTFRKKGVVFQIGVAPRRIDILTHIDGVDFRDAYRAREKIEVEGMTIPFLSRKDLLQNKEATGRDKDRLDARILRKIRKPK